MLDTLVSFPISVGIVPDSMFHWRLSIHSFVSNPISVGIVPDSEFPVSSRLSSCPLSVNNSAGRVPLTRRRL